MFTMLYWEDGHPGGEDDGNEEDQDAGKGKG